MVLFLGRNLSYRNCHPIMQRHIKKKMAFAAWFIIVKNWKPRGLHQHGTD